MEFGVRKALAARKEPIRSGIPISGADNSVPTDTLISEPTVPTKSEGPDSTTEGYEFSNSGTLYRTKYPQQTISPVDGSDFEPIFTRTTSVELVGPSLAIPAPTGGDEAGGVTTSPAHSSLSGAHLFSAVFFPIAGCFVLCLLGLLCFRLRRQRKRMVESSELKDLPSPSTDSSRYPEYEPRSQYPPGFPPAVLAGQTSNTPVYRRPNYQGYYSGIDSSAAAEPGQGEAGGLSYRGIDADPPPPYAPRPSSVAQRLSQANLASHDALGMRSPFADPVEDDAVSEVSSVGDRRRVARRDIDNASVVSEVADHNNPATPHQMV